MKKFFAEPKIEEIKFSVEDVITVSSETSSEETRENETPQYPLSGYSE